MPVYSNRAETDVEGRELESVGADSPDYTFEERIGLVVNALDDIRYEDGFDYEHRDMARQLAKIDEEFQEVYEWLETNQDHYEENADRLEKLEGEYEDLEEQYQQIAELDGVPEEFTGLKEKLGDFLEDASAYIGEEERRMEEEASRLQRDRDLREKASEVKEYFNDVKYNGETESGPGAFIVLVDGPAERFADYANQNKAGEKDAVVNDGAAWFRDGINAQWGDEEFESKLAELIYRTMERMDGAIIAGEDGFLPDTYLVPDADAPEEAYPDMGTKHEAAVNAVYNGEMDAEAIVLSETDGAIRWFRSGERPQRYAYDPDEQDRLEFQNAA